MKQKLTMTTSTEAFHVPGEGAGPREGRQVSKGDQHEAGSRRPARLGGAFLG